MVSQWEAVGVVALSEFVLTAVLVLFVAPLEDVVWILPPLVLFGLVLGAYLVRTVRGGD